MRQSVFLYLPLIWALFQGPATAAGPIYDYRIVIDVSGSMKKTDPGNLRVSAMKLVNGLIPNGSRAGVWTFGKYVNMAVKWSKVDESWRKKADLGADQIHSNALLTNIESALKRASVGWKNPDPGSKRILLLLTDGQVDVSKDSAKNKESRDRVLTGSLAALKKAGAQVHTIALSDGADEVLLKQLALETDGSFSVANSADELQKVFFKMFERASLPDTVAFDGNEFPVDSSIKEMTLLIFRKPDSQSTILIPPDSPAISADKPRGARWRRDKVYDLITIANPGKGTWRIDAEMDPDSRLMVVTDLKLQVKGIPTYATPRETLEVAAELFNRDRKIRKNSFLRFVEFNITHTDPDGNETRSALTHTELREDKGRYIYRFEQKLAEGTHSFVISADSRTFSRNKRFDLQVQWPVEVKIEPQQETGVYRFGLRAREEYLKADGLTAEVEIEAPDGSRKPLLLDASSEGLTGIIDTDQDGLYHAHVKVSAQNHATEIRDFDLGSYSLIGIFRAPETAPSAETESETAAGEKIAPGTDAGRDADAAPEIQKTEQETGTDWRMILMLVGGVNLLLMLLAGGGWFLIKRRGSLENILVEDEEISV